MGDILNSPSHLLYSSLPNLIIGFHGCDQKVFETVLYDHKPLKMSRNDYDWLGNGIYFWEQNLERAWEWARNGAANPRINISKPAVIGAVINLGFCLNLLDSNNIKILQAQYKSFKRLCELSALDIPQNKNISGNDDLLLRKLDCAVIENLHFRRSRFGEKAYDSVRGVFFEGKPIYPTSGFRQQSHIQICVRNPNCILGFFSPKQVDPNWDLP